MGQARICAKLHQRPIERPPSVQAIIRRAWLPLQIWPDVPVVQETKRKLSLIERFAIETTLVLGQCRPKDLFEIISIPQELGEFVLAPNSKLVSRCLRRGNTARGIARATDSAHGSGGAGSRSRSVSSGCFYRL